VLNKHARDIGSPCRALVLPPLLMAASTRATTTDPPARFSGAVTPRETPQQCPLHGSS
jgi:hypothetical protein